MLLVVSLLLPILLLRPLPLLYDFKNFLFFGKTVDVESIVISVSFKLFKDVLAVIIKFWSNEASVSKVTSFLFLRTYFSLVSVPSLLSTSVLRRFNISFSA